MGLDFVGVKNLEVRGLTLVNSHAWTVCFTNCVGVNVREIAAFGYRMWSDGIMLSDCAHARIYDCFLRTGDDAAEVKSTSDGLVETDDVIFENVAVWTDKACGFGVVYENNHDTKTCGSEIAASGLRFRTGPIIWAVLRSVRETIPLRRTTTCILKISKFFIRFALPSPSALSRAAYGIFISGTSR